MAAEVMIMFLQLGEIFLGDEAMGSNCGRSRKYPIATNYWEYS